MFVYQRVPSGNQMWRDFVVSIGDLTIRHAGFRLACWVVCTHRVPSSNPRMQWRIAIFDANIIYKRFFAVQGLFITRHEYHQRVPYQSGWFAWNDQKLCGSGHYIWPLPEISTYRGRKIPRGITKNGDQNETNQDWDGGMAAAMSSRFWVCR